MAREVFLTLIITLLYTTHFDNIENGLATSRNIPVINGSRIPSVKRKIPTRTGSKLSEWPKFSFEFMPDTKLQSHYRP